MRKILFIVFGATVLINGFIFALPAHAAISIVSNDANGGHVKCGNGASLCSTANIDTSGATLYVAVISSYNVYGTIQTRVNGLSNNGTSLDNWACPSGAQAHNAAGDYIDICYAVAPTPGPWTDFLCSGAYVSCSVSIFGGTNVTASVITTSSAAAATGSVSSTSPGSVSTSAGYLTVTGWGSTANSISLGTSPSGYTRLDSNSGGSELIASAYLINGSSPQNPVWALTSGTEDMTSAVVVFEPITGTPIYVYNFTSGYAYSNATSTPLGTFSVVAGNYLMCGTEVYASFNTAFPVSITDNSSSSNTLTEISTTTYYNDSTNFMGSLWGGQITTTNTSSIFTVAFPDANYKGLIICHQYVNLASNPVDTASEAQATTTGPTQTIASSAFNTAKANEVVFAYAASDVGAVQTFTPGGSFTLRGLDYNETNPPNDIEQEVAAEDWQPGATLTSASSSMSWTAGSSRASGALIMSVGLEGAGGSTPSAAVTDCFFFNSE